MKRILKLLGILGLLFLLMAPAATGQERAARAAEISPSAGRPSGIEIKRNILAQKQAALEAEIREVNRCLRNAAQPTTLRDPEGNINFVPQTDLVNCGRRLATLERQLAAVARETEQLGADAQAQAVAVDRARRLAEQQARLQALSGGGIILVPRR